MRIVLLSDIHANAEAFVRVLNDIDRLGVGTILSLGDNIGYGPDPQEVIDILRQRNIPTHPISPTETADRTARTKA